VNGMQEANERLDDALSGARRWVKEAGGLQPFFVPLYAIVLAVVVGGILIAIIGKNPFEAYWALLRGMFGTGDRIAASISRSVPFVGSALAMAFAFKAGLFNIGVQGQIVVGGMVAAWFATLDFLEDTPGPISILLILLAGTIGGGFWGFIPGFLRTKTGAHEVISTIMLNNIGRLLAIWMVTSQDPIVLRDPDSSVPQTEPVASTGILPTIVDSTPKLHWGVFIAIGLCVLIWFVMTRTSFGFEVSTVGLNPDAATYAGVNVGKLIIVTMAISGAIAGLTAAGEVSGTHQSFQEGLFLNLGFDGIAIALLAKGNPFAIIPAALLWGSMLSGAALMQQQADVSIDVVRIVLSLVLLFVAADAIVRWIFRVKVVDPKAETARLAAEAGAT
jgi:general nucleoside transport system permease protein